MKRVHTTAGMLMISSSVIHMLHLTVYPLEYHVIGAAIFGIIYFFIGLFLLGANNLAFWMGAILPSIDGIWGVYRFLSLDPNLFELVHLMSDLIVVSICIYSLKEKVS